MSDGTKFGCVIVAIVSVAMAVVSIGEWYLAGVQVDVYRRQGVEMTQWEVFIGCTPAERQVHFKPEKE